MNGPNGAAASQPLLPLNSLIKAEDILKIPNFSDDTRNKYTDGVSKLWQNINSYPQDHETYKGAHRKLSEVTYQVRIHMRRNVPQANAGGGAPAVQGSTAQDTRPQSQQPIPLNGQLQVSTKNAQQAMSLPLILPPNMADRGSEAAQKWMKDARTKYAHQLQRYETYSTQLVEMNKAVKARTETGGSFTEQEKQDIIKNKNAAEAMRNSAHEFIMKFKQQQEQFKSALIGGNSSAPQLDGATNGNTQFSNLGNGESKPPSQGPHPQRQQQQPEHQGQVHTVSSALDAARQQAGPLERTAMSPTNAQTSQPQANSVSALQGQHIKKEPQTSQPSLNINTDAGPPNSQHDSPHVGQPSTASSQGPHPLSHQAAMASAAQKYAQQNYQQTPQSTTHAHPTMSNRSEPQNNNLKFPIPKELKVGPLQQSTMGPARPTLTGGPSTGAMGPMGQPAIPRHPGFVLEGEGDRVLSKKRLQQLMREVTGASEGDDAEVMTPDVEETLLQVADDFIDQVISSACKLAKLRQASQLDIRDLQIILERNYNIRVPGYASDELRTVKKIQPTPAWTQKLSAVQAAKVTGGKTDL